MTELRNCPFCGSEPEVFEFSTLEKPKFSVWCVNKKCLITMVGGIYDTEEAAIKAWNTRANSTTGVPCFNHPEISESPRSDGGGTPTGGLPRI